MNTKTDTNAQLKTKNIHKLMLKALPILVGITLLIFTLGLSFFYIEGHFALFTLSLASSLTMSSALVFIYLIIVYRKLSINHAKSATFNQYKNTKRFKRITIIFSIIIGSLVFISVNIYLANSLHFRWDVTQNKQHTLSKNTTEFISTLTQKVELTALYVGLPPKYLQDLFKEYERVSAGLITTQIIDPIENIAYAAKFGNVLSANERKIIVQSGLNVSNSSEKNTSNSRQDIDFTDALLTQEKLNHAIARANRAPRQAYFLNGHGEYSLSNSNNIGLTTFKQLLADNNIKSKPLMLGITQAIPDDCDVLIIAGPRTELTENEEALIVNYLTLGGDALFLIEHTQVTTSDKPLTTAQKKQNPSLNSILNQWGLNVQSDIVVDLTNHIGDDVGSPATKNYQKHKAITQGLDYTFYVRPRSIRVLEQRRSTIKLAAIASTTSVDKSWAETNRTLDIQYDHGVDTLGPVPISYVVLEEHPEKSSTLNNNKQSSDVNNRSNTRIIVFTDADFLTNVYINQYSNAQMGINLINWLAELDYQVILDSNAIKVERLDLTSKQKRQVVVVLFLLPFFFFIVGIVVWLRSKSH